MMRERTGYGTLLVTFAITGACGGESGAGLQGRVEIDGSSTVYLVSEAVAEEFTIATRSSVRATVAYSGTGGGFKRFCAGETDISNASRAIKPSEAELCERNGVDYVRFAVALDGVSVVVNPANDFVQCITTDELRRIWEPESALSTWSDIRPEWPAEPLRLYGPGTNSGTFDYFTSVITGEEKASRADYTASEDDNVLVQGVEGDEYALGYFGYAYYAENRDRLRAVQVDGGNGCVPPTPSSIEADEYAPLSRPLMIYVNRAALARPAVRHFLEFYLDHAVELVPQVGYVAMDVAHYQSERTRLQAETDGDQNG